MSIFLCEACVCLPNLQGPHIEISGVVNLDVFDNVISRYINQVLGINMS